MILTILTAILTTLTICYLLSRYYQRHLEWWESAWQKQRQVIFWQMQRIEELEIEREMLHEVAARALPELPSIEEYHEAGGLRFTVWRN